MLSLFSKLKGLLPTLIVASAVAITVKLLTTETPQNSEIFQVKAEEDIKTESYEDIIEEPEPEVVEEEVLPEEEESDVTEQDAEETEEEERGGGDEEQEPEEKQEKQEQQKQPVANRRFKQTLMGNLLGKLIKPKDKN